MRTYGLTDPVPRALSIGCGLQHVLAMFVGLITPPLIVAGAVKLDSESGAALLSMALFTSGFTTLMQTSRLGPIGSGMLSVQGTSFTFVQVAIQTHALGGLQLVLGMSALCSVFQVILSRAFGILRQLFPPVVTGSVVMLIGLSLVQYGLTDLAGGYGAEDFGAPHNFGLGLVVLAMILLTNWAFGGRIAPVSVAAGLFVGYVLAAVSGLVDFSTVASATWFALPKLLPHGFDFDPVVLVPWLVAYFITTMETVGDLTATSDVSGEPVQGPVFTNRIRRGLLADGLGSGLAGLFGALPNTTFSQNNAVIRLTGVASRRVGQIAGVMLVLLGLSPKVASIIRAMPSSVLGGATVVLFGMIVMSGISIVARDGFSRRNQLVVALALSFGLGVQLVPDAVRALPLPAALTTVLQSSLSVGGLVALMLNAVLPRDPDADSKRA